MGKIAENKQQKEQSLMDTAFQLFTTKGIVKTSIADIVAQAGVAKGTFYLYFQDKYDIRDKLIARKTEQMFRHAMDHANYAAQPHFADKLIVIIDDVLNQLQASPDVLRFINKNLSWGVFRRALDKAPSDYLELFRELLSMEEETWREPEIMLYTIIEMVGSTCHSIILEQDPVDLAHYKPHLYGAVRAIVESFRIKEV
jgi:AcrR family transcriptional regulator